jgi:hypothetical protein
MPDLVDKVRARLWHRLDPITAAVIDLTVEDLKQVVIGTRGLTAQQIAHLARHMGIK